MNEQARYWKHYSKPLDPDDIQRHSSYCWEEFLYDFLDQQDEKTMLLQECRNLIGTICDRFGVTNPEVKDGRGCSSALAGIDLIHLPRYFRDLLSTIHEASHVIHAHIAPDEECHGPHFIRLCIYHFSQYLDITVEELEKSATAFDLKFTDRLSCIPPPWFKVKAIIAQRKVMKGFSRMRQAAEKQAKSLATKELAAKRKHDRLSRETSNRLWFED